MLTPRCLATRVRTSLEAKTSLIAVVCSLSIKLPIIIISPHSLHALVMRPSNPPRNVALFKNLESVAIATQFLEAPGGRSKWKSTREDLKTRKERVRQALRHDNGAERNCGWGLGLCRIEWMSRLSFDFPAVISRWKQKNARRRRVLWIFATCMPGAAWKRSAPLQTKRTELV